MEHHAGDAARRQFVQRVVVSETFENRVHDKASHLFSRLVLLWISWATDPTDVNAFHTFQLNQISTY